MMSGPMLTKTLPSGWLVFPSYTLPVTEPRACAVAPLGVLHAASAMVRVMEIQKPRRRYEDTRWMVMLARFSRRSVVILAKA